MPHGRVDPAELSGLWDLARVEPLSALARADALAAGVDEARDPETAAALRTLRAEALARLARYAEAVDAVREVRERWPAASAEVFVRGEWVVGRVLGAVGDWAGALERTLDALARCDDSLPRRLRAAVLTKLADVLAALGCLDDARERYRQAEAVAAGDPEMHLRAVNNLAYTEYEEGDLEVARALVDRLGELSRHYGRELDSDVLDTLACIHLADGRADLAVEVARRALARVGEKDAQNVEDVADLRLTLAVAQRRTGDLDGCGASLAAARALAVGTGEIATRVLQEQAELHAARGDFEAAFRVHRDFHEADRRLTSQRRDEQARARQAVFAVTEARAEAARFREEARRDPLTGLSNRLHVDETLPRLLDLPRPDHVLAVAVLDLDHFKSVNDVYSHAAGDEVLRRVADVLRTTGTDEAGFAARLGGEEFLLVLRCDSARHAAHVLEGVRARVEGTDWSGLTPGRGATLSAGLTTARPEDTQRSVLARADALLYEAKRSGRNQVRAGS